MAEMIKPRYLAGFTGHRPKDSPGHTATALKQFATLQGDLHLTQ